MSLTFLHRSKWGRMTAHPVLQLGTFTAQVLVRSAEQTLTVDTDAVLHGRERAFLEEITEEQQH